MRFDVIGRTFEARVTSVRHVEWGDSRSGGFMFVFRPGLFDQAPHTFVAFVKAPEDTTARARFQYDLVARYPNVTAIDGREILAQIQTVIDNAVLGISIVGGIALMSGVLILIGAVAMTKFQRVYEAAILRTLGAGTRLLTMTLAIEYCALGLLAGTIGAAGALGLSWGVARHVLDIPWRPAPGLLGAGAVLTMLLVTRHRRPGQRGRPAQEAPRDAPGGVKLPASSFPLPALRCAPPRVRLAASARPRLACRSCYRATSDGGRFQLRAARNSNWELEAGSW